MGDTLDLCSDIVEAVGDFLSIFETEERRRKDENLGMAVTKKLKTCRSIIDLVDGFRKNHFSPKARGHIALQLGETRFLNEMLKGESKKLGETVYVASKDGDSPAQFHKKCDNEGPTVVIVQSTTGAVFGGYTDMNWKSTGNYVKSSRSFLFRLRPAMTKYSIISAYTKYGIYTKSDRGPSFGHGNDLYIAKSCLSNTNSYTNGGHSYKISPRYQLNDGTKNFKVKDYAVVKAIKM